MIKKIILIIFVVGFSVCLEHVVEVYDNGNPKVVKSYSSYGSKLTLNKEIGYYANSFKEYEKKYRNGDLVSTNYWSSDGTRVTQGQTYGNKWTLSQKKEAEESLCQRAPNQEACNCVIDLLTDELTYKEFQAVNASSGPNDPSIDEKLKDRVLALGAKFQECVFKSLGEGGGMQELEKTIEKTLDSDEEMTPLIDDKTDTESVE